ncbi:MAG: hypothetical protein MJA32_14555 [Proteobacteria bacterium]|nr:hypothetical protein [Pseudomonadota bacterium]
MTGFVQRCTRAAVCLLLPGLVGGCQSERHEELRGSLYFGAGPYLARLDLRDGSTSVVTNLGDAEIRGISPQLDERLLLTVFGSVNRQDVHRLILYDKETRQTLGLVTGRHGRYLPGTKILVYDDGGSIRVAEKIRGSWEKSVIAEHRYNASMKILPISAKRFLYAESGQPIYAFDNIAKRSIELAALSERCDLAAALWIPERGQLLCRTRRSDGLFEYPFVALDGGVRELLAVPGKRSFRPIAWLPDQDTIVLTERWRSALSDRQKHAVWVYRFDAGDHYRLLDDQHLGDSVVYEPNQAASHP